MPYDIEDTLTRLAEAVMEVLAIEVLRRVDPGEPYVVSQLFLRMHARFRDWDVGNEYDRVEDITKRLRHFNPATGKELEADIIPDLIVHRMGVRDNLLVVEVKRHINHDTERDVWKLRGMTAQQGEYRYAVGVHLILNVPAGVVVGCDVYTDGDIDAAWSAWLRARLPA